VATTWPLLWTSLGSASPSPFRYARSRHVRRLKPGPFSKPRDYIDALAEEFYHCCVYCLLPDVGGGSFEVEHYWPESKFEDLSTEYSNLFYSCRGCNGRKGKKWFEPKQGGAYIVNPCQDAMGDHLWYERLRVAHKSEAGRLSSEVFRFNDADSVGVREDIALMLAEVWTRLVDFRKKRKKLVKKIGQQNLAGGDRGKLEAALQKLDADIARREELLRRACGRQATEYKL